MFIDVLSMFILPVIVYIGLIVFLLWLGFQLFPEAVVALIVDVFIESVFFFIFLLGVALYVLLIPFALLFFFWCFYHLDVLFVFPIQDWWRVYNDKDIIKFNKNETRFYTVFYSILTIILLIYLYFHYDIDICANIHTVITLIKSYSVYCDMFIINALCVFLDIFKFICYLIL